MSTTLVLTEDIARALRANLSLDVETGAVVLVRPVAAATGDLRLLAREVHFVPESAYVRREQYELLISSAGYVPALARAEETGTIPIWFHTHPGEHASPSPSAHDHRVDRELMDVFQLRSNSGYYGALIFAGSERHTKFTGFLAPHEGERVGIDRVLVVGRRIEVFWHNDAVRPELDAIFDRNVRAFGGEVQSILRDLHIAVVGAGGTGSAVAEQLIRLGVRRMLLADPDRLSASNVTRVYGSSPDDVGELKVDVLARHLLRIAPDALIERIPHPVTVERVARQLADVDLIFGCTDDNAGRLVLSRTATYMLTPVLDLGVVLSSDTTGRLDGVFGRITILHPGAGCLVCRDRIDLARARSELMSVAERERLEKEGYAPALAGVEPAVVAFTTAVASMAVAELLERLTGYGPEPAPTELLLRIHDREISTNVSAPRRGHYCHPDAKKLGLGITQPFLEQVWPE